MKREKNLHFLRMAVMIAIGVPAACMTCPGGGDTGCAGRR